MCAPSESLQLGVSLSLWTDDDVAAACGAKPVEAIPQGPATGWPFFGPRAFPCPASCAASTGCAALPHE